MSGYSKFVPLAYAIAGGSVASIATPAFDPENYLMVLVRISGYAGSGIAQLQFNGDTGTTAYSYRVSSNFAVATTGVATAASGIKVSQTATGGARALVTFFIGNINGRPHGITYHSSDLSESAATAPDIVLGAGVWTNTAQIRSIVLTGDGVNILTGSDISVFGLAGAP